MKINEWWLNHLVRRGAALNWPEKMRIFREEASVLDLLRNLDTFE